MDLTSLELKHLLYGLIIAIALDDFCLQDPLATEEDAVVERVEFLHSLQPRSGDCNAAWQWQPKCSTQITAVLLIAVAISELTVLLRSRKLYFCKEKPI